MRSNTILIVDDNTTNVKVLGNLLKACNYNVEFALNGKSAIDWIMKKDFDLILLDIMMPEMDGFEVATILKDVPQKKDIPIVFLTAKSDEESILKGFESGGVDFLTKPFNHSELLARVATHIALKSAREEIKQKNRLIMESIHYAKLIQNALLPTEKFKRIFPESFIIYYPKDIVSGDFYWINKFNDKVVLVAADCTGHGIPGAFMSILGIALLNEIILNANTFGTSDILGILREKIKVLLGQNENELDQGIDMSLCILDLDKKQLQYSGAHSSLYLLRDNELSELKGDRQPVGTYLKESLFSSETVKIKKRDRIYLASDGVSDQFGGAEGKKLGTGSFKKLLIDVQKSSIFEQSQKIDQYIKSWKGDFEQVDDIMVLGIQI